MPHWDKLEFVFAALLVVAVLVVFSFYFDAAALGEFRFVSKEAAPVAEQPQPLVQPQTDSEVSYVYANGQRIASVSGNEIKFYHSDYLGSSRIITDETGNKISSSDNYPFGSVLHEEGSVDKYKFTGKELDSTGLSYFGARYYDSATGRFTQVDPMGVGYAYANNNPMKFVDPTGEEPKLTVETMLRSIENSPYGRLLHQSSQPAIYKPNSFLSLWKFATDPLGQFTLGRYDPKLKRIILHEYSAPTLLHEFVHHAQFQQLEDYKLGRINTLSLLGRQAEQIEAGTLEYGAHRIGAKYALSQGIPYEHLSPRERLALKGRFTFEAGLKPIKMGKGTKILIGSSLVANTVLLSMTFTVFFEKPTSASDLVGTTLGEWASLGLYSGKLNEGEDEWLRTQRYQYEKSYVSSLDTTPAP